MKKITEGKGNWYELDAEAWNDAAERLKAEGWTQKPDRYRSAVFHKDGQTVALVRSLGQSNWHPRDVDVVHTDPLVVGR